MALIKCHECRKSVSTEATACPHCGAPAKAPDPAQVAPAPASKLLAEVRSKAEKERQERYNRRLIIVAAVVGATFLAVRYATRSAPEPSESTERYGALTSAFNVEITRALVTADVSGCGQYRWQPVLNRRGEYRVYCTGDGERHTSYRVLPGSGRVTLDYSTMDTATQDALYPHSRLR
jgi:hypothetical protein